MSLHKPAVMKRVAQETRLSWRIAADVIAASRRLIEETLRAGEPVTFPGCGMFSPSRRQEGRARRIRTGRTVTLPARMVARFRAGEVLKRAVVGKRRR